MLQLKTMRKRFKDSFWGFIGGYSLIVIAGLPQARAQVECKTDPTIDSAKKTLNVLATQDGLDDVRNCAHSSHRQRVKAGKKSLDSQIDAFLKQPDLNKTVNDGIQKDFKNSIDFLVEEAGTSKKTYKDYGVVLQKKYSDAVDVKTKAYNSPDHSGIANEGYAHAINSIAQPFQDNLMGQAVTPETRGKLLSARRAVVEDYSSEFQKSAFSDPALKAKIKSIAENKQCPSGFKLDLQTDPGMRTAKVTDKTSLEEARKALLDEVANGRKGNGPDGRDPLDPINSAKSWAYVCSPPHLQQAKLEPAPVHLPINLEKDDFFVDNHWDLNSDQENKIAQKIASRLKTNNPNCKRRLLNVNIETSASQFRNNCSNLSPEQCPDPKDFAYGFKKLSEERAKTLTRLVSQRYPQAKTSMNAAGENGDGTSGPCPYFRDGSDGQIKVVEKTPELKAQLEAARYGRLNLDVVEEGPGCNKKDGDLSPTLNKPQIFLGSKCFHVDVSCN